MQDEIDINNLEIEKLEKIGQGAFGTVWKCRDKRTNTIFALKTIQMNIFDLQSIVREVKILQDIAKHDRLIKCYGCGREGIGISFIMEFISQGSLRDIINKNGVMSLVKAAKYTKETLEGLAFLHEKNVIHRDIKCGNILLNDHDHVKLTDFGLSKLVEDKSMLDNHSFCGTIFFMAPEVLMRGSYSCSVDIWALGVTVVEMLTGLPIGAELPPILFVAYITSERPVPIKVPNMTKELEYFFKLTFVKDPNERPKSRDLIRCNFITSAET